MFIRYHITPVISSTLIILFLFFSHLIAMDPKQSLLDLPRLPLVKILADEKLRVKDRKRLMQTCHQLHCMTSPHNLLEATIALNLFRTIDWPFCALKTAVKSGNLECCLYIFDTQQTNVEKFKKTFAYKIAPDKSFYKNRFYRLNLSAIQIKIPHSSYSFVFYTPDVSYSDVCPRNTAELTPLLTNKDWLIEFFKRCGYPEIAQNYAQAKNIQELQSTKILALKQGSDEYPHNAADLIPLLTNKNWLIEFFKRCGYSEIAQNYAQAKNIQELQSTKILAFKQGIVYPPNILGHACVFGNVKLLKKILSSCHTIDELSMYSPYPASVLPLAAEYHQPECFKLLYETPWLKNHFILYHSFSSKKYGIDNYLRHNFYNHLEVFIFYYHDKKFIETLLQTGCFNINKSMHYMCVKRGGKEYCVSNKIPEGKTLLDIILEEKNRKKKKYIKAPEYRPLDPHYCQHIENLLRKYGGKTAQEIASIHHFNKYISKYIQKDIFYSLRLLKQQELRLVCSAWKKVIDDNPETFELSILRIPTCLPGELYYRLKLHGLYNDVIKRIMVKYALLNSKLLFARYAFKVKDYCLKSYCKKQNLKKEFFSRPALQQLI